MRLVRILVATLAIFCLAAIEIQADGLSGTSLYKKCLPSVMVLTVKNKTGDPDLGTAFMAVKDGLAVTAWHVVKNAKSVTATFSDGTQCTVTGLIDKDEQRDIALIRVKVTGRPKLTLATDRPEIGSKAYVIGSPLGLAFTISDGLISQTWHSKGASFYQYTCPSSPGNSGGPVLNSNGQVIGVVDWQTSEGQNLNFAVPAAYVRDLDSTMATTPWSAVKSAGTSGGSDQSGNGTNDVNDAIDTQLGKADWDIRDSKTYLYYLTTRMNQSGAYKDPVPPTLYALQGAINDDLESLSQITTDDAQRARIQANRIETLQHISRAIDYLSKAILTAQSDEGWSAESNDLVSRSQGELEAITQVSDKDLDVLFMSKSYSATYDADGTEVFLNTLSLGVECMHREELFICDVISGKLADHLGLQPGDTILLVDGHHVKTLKDVAAYLLKDVGGNADISVDRNGQQADVKGDVPQSDEQILTPFPGSRP